MKISVFGLGYVGCVTAGCLAQNGHDVIGVDVNSAKVRTINDGKSPIVEAEIEQIIDAAVVDKQLSATISTEEAVLNTDVSLICVGTPSNGNGSLDLRSVEICSKEIGTALNKKSGFHAVAVRSTVMPGSTRDVIAPILEKYSQKKSGIDFGVCTNPEFLREGTSVADFLDPPFTLIGCREKRVIEIMSELYSFIQAPLVETDTEVAEIVKYVNNGFHALKVCFANEIGNVCKAVGIDSHEVMRIFCQDHKLNISSNYLKPGFAFGGSCLPKDLKAVTYLAKSKDVHTPVLNAILPSNNQQLKNAIDIIAGLGKKPIGIYGLSFKSGTDDLRESPMVVLAEYLIGKGYDLRIYDRNVSLATIFGANREFIEREIPHIQRLLTDCLDEFLRFADIVVVGHRPCPEDFSKLEGKTIVDLVRMTSDRRREAYYGLCW
jgi:GDP-mannose 6-dehydrogenase